MVMEVLMIIIYLNYSSEIKLFGKFYIKRLYNSTIISFKLAGTSTSLKPYIISNFIYIDIR